MAWVIHGWKLNCDFSPVTESIFLSFSLHPPAPWCLVLIVKLIQPRINWCRESQQWRFYIGWPLCMSMLDCLDYNNWSGQTYLRGWHYSLVWGSRLHKKRGEWTKQRHTYMNSLLFPLDYGCYMTTCSNLLLSWLFY